MLKTEIRGAENELIIARDEKQNILILYPGEEVVAYPEKSNFVNLNGHGKITMIGITPKKFMVGDLESLSPIFFVSSQSLKTIPIIRRKNHRFHQ